MEWEVGQILELIQDFTPDFYVQKAANFSNKTKPSTDRT